MTTALSSKRRQLSSCLPAGTPTIVRHVTADHDSPIVCHPSSDHPQNEVQDPNNSDDNKDKNSCSHSQRLFLLLDVNAPILYAWSDSFSVTPVRNTNTYSSDLARHSSGCSFSWCHANIDTPCVCHGCSNVNTTAISRCRRSIDAFDLCLMQIHQSVDAEALERWTATEHESKNTQWSWIRGRAFVDTHVDTKRDIIYNSHYANSSP